MTTTQKRGSTLSKRFLVIGTTFTAGLVLGALALFAIQNLGLQNKHGTEVAVPTNIPQTLPEIADIDSTADIFEVGEFQEIFKHRSISEQLKAIHTTLSRATEQDLKDWWNKSQNIERTSHREIAQQVILRNLAAINPQQALRYIDDVSIFQSNALLMSVFSEWSVSQLDQAIEVTTTLSGPRRKVALEAILETRDDLSESRRHAIAEQLDEEETFLRLVSDRKASESRAEPKESWDILLNDDVDDALQTESLAIVAEAWQAQVGFKVLSHIFTETPNIRFQLVRAIAQVDLASALDYTRGILDENEQQYLSKVIIQEWANTDAPAALAAVSTLTPSSLASYLENEVAITWAIANPNEMIDNIEAISEELRLYALETAFSGIARQDPLEAIAKVSSVESFVGNTSSILRSIVFRWSYQEPDVAAEWVVNNFVQDDPQRRTLLEKVLPRWARQDPNQAFELAIAQPTPSEGFGLEHLVIEEITSEGEVELAKKLLPRVKENTKLYAYTQVGSAMVRQLQIAEALELGKEFEETEQRMYYERVLNTWARTDPRNLYESLEDLPTKDIQSGAAKQLIMNNRYTPAFDDDEIEHARTLLSDEDKAILKRIESR